MRTGAKILTIVILLALGIGVYFLVKSPPSPNVPTPTPNGNNNGTTEHPLIRVSEPMPNSLVSSPVRIRGEARGNWYFEASFPVKILDANGRQLGIAPAQAQGEWMTTEFVPFDLTLTFSAPTTSTGTIVLEKDNPSGLPEHADEIRIPVKFNPAPTNTRVTRVFFYNSLKDQDASGNILCSNQGLVALDRFTPITNTPIQDAVKELLKGPTAAEKVLAPDSEFPLPGLTLTSASLSGGVLTLTFNDPQNKTTGGSCRVTILRAQIEATAKNFSEVKSVRLLPATLFQP